MANLRKQKITGTIFEIRISTKKRWSRLVSLSIVVPVYRRISSIYELG